MGECVHWVWNGRADKESDRLARFQTVESRFSLLEKEGEGQYRSQEKLHVRLKSPASVQECESQYFFAIHWSAWDESGAKNVPRLEEALCEWHATWRDRMLVLVYSGVSIGSEIAERFKMSGQKAHMHNRVHVLPVSIDKTLPPDVLGWLQRLCHWHEGERTEGCATPETVNPAPSRIDPKNAIDGPIKVFCLLAEGWLVHDNRERCKKGESSEGDLFLGKAVAGAPNDIPEGQRLIRTSAILNRDHARGYFARSPEDDGWFWFDPLLDHLRDWNESSLKTCFPELRSCDAFLMLWGLMQDALRDGEEVIRRRFGGASGSEEMDRTIEAAFDEIRQAICRYEADYRERQFESELIQLRHKELDNRYLDTDADDMRAVWRNRAVVPSTTGTGVRSPRFRETFANWPRLRRRLEELLQQSTKELGFEPTEAGNAALQELLCSDDSPACTIGRFINEFDSLASDQEAEKRLQAFIRAVADLKHTVDSLVPSRPTGGLFASYFRPTKSRTLNR